MSNEKPVTWRKLVPLVGRMNEEEIKALLNYEVSSTNRSSVVLRLHQRYTKLRMFRERIAIRKGELL